MLTGVRPFRGDDVADTLAAVLRAEPDWSMVRNDVPSGDQDDYCEDCLTKDRAKRLSPCRRRKIRGVRGQPPLEAAARARPINSPLGPRSASARPPSSLVWPAHNCGDARSH
jgi:hypothetical protein